MTTPDSPKRILMIRPSALGDVCRTVPVLVSLRAAYPDADIDWVVQDTILAAIDAHPALSRAIAFPRTRFAGWWRSPRRAREMKQWFDAIRRSRYDLVLDCQGLGRSGLISFVSGAPVRVGLRRAREFGWLGYNRRVKHHAGLHTVDQMMTLVKHLGIEPVYDMRLYVTQAHAAWWDTARRECGIGDVNYAVIAPTSRWRSKRWPVEHFAALIDPLLQRGHKRIVLIGAPGEEAQLGDLVDANHSPCDSGGSEGSIVNLVGKTSIGQTMAVIERSSLVIANDSAPLHMAVGFDRPCIALFGPTDPARVGPFRREACVVRKYEPASGSPAHFKDAKLGDSLMRLIGVDDVLEHLDGMEKTASPSGESVETRQREEESN